MRVVVMVDELAERLRLLEGREILALDVLDERDLDRRTPTVRELAAGIRDALADMADRGSAETVGALVRELFPEGVELARESAQRACDVPTQPRATAAPMPWAAPVTIVTLSLSSMGSLTIVQDR